MLAILPLLAFASVFLSLGNLRPSWEWNRVFLRSLILSGAATVLATEVLSLIRAISPAGLAVFWVLLLAAPGAVLAGKLRRGERIRLPSLRARPTAWDWFLLAGIALVAAVTALVAWFAPPNSWDALTYHMARVAHWAQDRTLAHYATGIPRQIQMTPGAEIFMLHAYVLAGGDRLVNFVQWGAMAASVIGAATLARQMGVGRTGRLFAALFVAAMPVGIAQASSAFTDYVVAAWMIAVASEVWGLFVGEESSQPFYLGLAAGLALLTKLSAVGYLLALGAYAALRLQREYGVRRALRSGAIAAGMVLVLNGGHLARNISTYGHPLGGERQISMLSIQYFDWRVVVSNTLRNLSLHAATPWEGVNRLVFHVVVGVHARIGMDLNDGRISMDSDYRILRARSGELRSGNLLQAIFMVVGFSALVVLACRGDSRARTVLGYTALVGLGFVVQSSVVRFSSFGSRYHLILFVLLAPAVAWVFRSLPRVVLVALGFGLVAYAWPWLFRLEPRPLVADRSGRSVLTMARESLYLPPALEFPYREIAATIRQASCDAVGVMLRGDAAEYPLWVYLGAPRADLTIEWIVAGTPSERYRRTDFEPCAVVCDSSCPMDWTMVGDLPWRLELSGYRLYMDGPGAIESRHP